MSSLEARPLTLKIEIQYLQEGKMSTNEVSQIFRDVDQGALSMGEGLRRVAEIQSQATERAVKDSVQETVGELANQVRNEFARRDTISTEQQFYKDHPDFLEIQKSGALERIKAEQPMHDQLSAYYAYKAKQEFQRGKAEKPTPPGGPVDGSSKPTKPLNDIEMKERGMAILDGLETQGG